MTEPKLETALQGLQDAINDLDKTILDNAGKFREQEAGTAPVQTGDAAMSAQMLRAELQALRQMINQATTLINGEAAAGTTDEVLH